MTDGPVVRGPGPVDGEMPATPRRPGGPAGGALSGRYPDPDLAPEVQALLDDLVARVAALESVLPQLKANTGGLPS